VSDHNTALDRSFIEAQRKRLEILRARLSRSEQETEAKEKAFEEEHGEEAREFEEEGQRMARIEIEQGLHAVDDRRLRVIDRALRKIEEGTYGLSDISGDPIPKARLEAVPEACLTIEEEERQEKRDGR
jgi:DnaK suppressor protein